MKAPLHIPVMINEVLQLLEPDPNYTYIDGTLGLAGHSKAILEASSGNCNLIGFDRDERSLKLAEKNLQEYKNVQLFHARFSEIPEILSQIKLTKPLGGILLDLGISSMQLDSTEYGLSFGKSVLDEPLDMRLDPWCKESAADILNNWPEKKLADLFWDTADYRPARKLAKLVINRRPFKTLRDFVSLCEEASPRGKIHSATLPLMALRMAVNDELGELEKGLVNITNWMEPGANLAVISFHSGEDRIVKNVFKKSSQLKILTEKPWIPSREEIKKNPRSRSAKLRAACRINPLSENST